MERIFIVDKDSTFKQNTRIEDLVNFELGAYGMAKHSQELEPLNLGTAYDWIQFYSGGSKQGSPTFDVVTDKWTKFIKVPYADPTYNTWRVEFTNDKVGRNDTFEVIVYVKDDESLSYPKYENFQVVSNGKTKEKLYLELAKQIEQSKYFDAAVDQGSLVITTVDDFHFPIHVGGKYYKEGGACSTCETSDIITTELVKWSKGSGSLAEVRELDRLYLPSRGDYSDDFDSRVPRPALYGDALTPVLKNSSKFTLYHLEYANKRSNGGDNGREGFEKRHLFTLAVHVENTTVGPLYEKVVKEVLGLNVQVSALQ